MINLKSKFEASFQQEVNLKATAKINENLSAEATAKIVAGLSYGNSAESKTESDMKKTSFTQEVT